LASQSDLPEGTLVVTPVQTAGRGQQGNGWESAPYQNLTFSILLKPKFLEASSQFQLSIAVSLALQEVLQQYLPQMVCYIKWPNDLYVEEQKLCGLLIENSLKGSRIEQCIVGIGLNVNQTNFATAPHAGSIKQLSGQQAYTEEVLERLLKAIEQQYLLLQAGAASQQRERYLSLLYRREQKHLFRTDVVWEGTIIGVDAYGRLQIEREGAIQTFGVKEVAFV
jgi:BirA family biotin operon repressor/biotin-[acetyl-CoA-carboxylase] ligase